MRYLKYLEDFFCKISLFIKQQRKEVSIKGKRAIFIKIYHLFIAILFLLPSLLVVITIRLLQPFVLIRFGNLHASRIGSNIVWTAIYFYERNTCKNSNKKIFDIFYYFYPICNKQMLKMWRKILHVPRFPFLLHLIRRLNYCIPGYKKHVIVIDQKRLKKEDFYSRIVIPLSFTAKEEKLGQDLLKKIGILNDKPFVCFHARDSAYLNNLFPGDDFNYHNYRDIDINNYYTMAEKLTEKGYFVIRIGAKVHKPFVTDNPMVIDYATKFRSDFLDIYLCAKCNFFIGCGSGVDEISKLFKRPLIYVNFIPIGWVPVGGVAPLFIPKKLWLKSEKRFLTFREIFNSELALLNLTEEYEKLGIEGIENTPEEISALALEMDEIIRGIWTDTDEDEKLQERFRSICRTFDPQLEVKTKIGREFLRQNEQLLC